MSDIQLITIFITSATETPNQLKTYPVMDDNSLRLFQVSSASN